MDLCDWENSGILLFGTSAFEFMTGSNKNAQKGHQLK